MMFKRIVFEVYYLFSSDACSLATAWSLLYGRRLPNFGLKQLQLATEVAIYAAKHTLCPVSYTHLTLPTILRV